MKLKLRTIVYLIISLFLVSDLYASEIKIIDNLGLVRASAEIKDPVSVKVTIKKTEQNTYPETFELIQEDGLIGNKPFQRKDGNSYQVNNIPPGIWKINLSSENYILENVEIVK